MCQILSVLDAYQFLMHLLQNVAQFTSISWMLTALVAQVDVSITLICDETSTSVSTLLPCIPIPCSLKLSVKFAADSTKILAIPAPFSVFKDVLRSRVYTDHSRTLTGSTLIKRLSREV